MQDSYGDIAQAHQILIAATPPGGTPPTNRIIRRAAERGEIRWVRIGKRYAFHLGDVAKLIATPIGGAR